MHFFTVMRKNTVALNQAITYNDTQSKSHREGEETCIH